MVKLANVGGILFISNLVPLHRKETILSHSEIEKIKEIAETTEISARIAGEASRNIGKINQD